MLTQPSESYPPDWDRDETLAARIPPDVRVIRSAPLRLLGQLVNVPDDKTGWLIPAVRAGLRLRRQEPYDAILATGSPWSTLVTGAVLSRLTRVPLILDYRDPWTRNLNTRSQRAWRRTLERRLEQFVVRTASGIVLNTEELRRSYVEDYPEVSPDRFVTIPNGFDIAERAPASSKTAADGPLIVTHAGHVYASRNPVKLLDALASLRDRGRISAGAIRVRFIGTTDVDLGAMVRERALGDFVELQPQVVHREALDYLASSDVLLLLQGSMQLQVPAKLYEYMGIGRPILALTDSTAIRDFVQRYELGWTCDPGSPDAIAQHLTGLLTLHHTDGLRYSGSVPDAYRADTLVRELADFCTRSLDRRPHA